MREHHNVRRVVIKQNASRGMTHTCSWPGAWSLGPGACSCRAYSARLWAVGFDAGAVRRVVTKRLQLFAREGLTLAI